MNYKVYHFIYEREVEKGKAYEFFEMDSKESFNSPYLAGEYQLFISFDDAKKHKLKRKLIDEPIFNKSNITRRILDIGKSGLYFLELRVGYRLADLIVDPDDVIIDIYPGIGGTLIYSFYNNSNKDKVVITTRIEVDDEDMPKKLGMNPKDLIWRNYFVKRAQGKNLDKNIPRKIEDKIERDVMTAKEAADYLRINIKTLQNYASEGKVETIRGGKYRKEDLDEYLNRGSTPKKKRK
jgi:hypothetical protein